jgi:hypothetical protein
LLTDIDIGFTLLPQRKKAGCMLDSDPNRL